VKEQREEERKKEKERQERKGKRDEKTAPRERVVSRRDGSFIDKTRKRSRAFNMSGTID